MLIHGHIYFGTIAGGCEAMVPLCPQGSRPVCLIPIHTPPHHHHTGTTLLYEELTSRHSHVRGQTSAARGILERLSAKEPHFFDKVPASGFDAYLRRFTSLEDAG